jgi:hypothetical protein
MFPRIHVSKNIEARAEDKFAVSLIIKDIKVHEGMDDVEHRTLIQVKLPGYAADTHGFFRLGKQLQDSKTLVYGWHSFEERAEKALH